MKISSSAETISDTPATASQPSRYLQRPSISVELLAVLVSLYFTLTCNFLFFKAAFADKDWTDSGTWLFAVSIFLAITALHVAILLLILNRWTAKPVLMALLLVTAGATYYMNKYTVFFNTDMVRNILVTDVKEAKELFSWAMALHIAVVAGIPILLLARVRLERRTWQRTIVIRGAMIILAVLLTIGSVMLVFQDFSSLMRNQKEVRFLITPAAYLTSFVRVVAADSNVESKQKISISDDAKLGAGWAGRPKPMLFVLVVGETTRGANWGLNGYEHQTNPELSKLNVVNFTHATSCGTNTEVSVPCMFSPFGRRNYDESAIKNHESLLHIINHVGLNPIWRDNQGGCKGVCDGLEEQRLDSSTHPVLCNADRCLDEILLNGMDGLIQKAKNGNMFVVLHQLGSHGPSYFSRYPANMRKFTPTCDTSDLSKCTEEEIVNTYDNTVLYTDHLLAKTIALLKQQSNYNTAMLYLSDHGESLGENGIFLHGLPYSIAPKEQTQIPMVLWMSPGFASSFALNEDCLKHKAANPVSHDNLFHSLLGMLQIDSKHYEKELDITASCRLSKNSS